VLAADSRVTLNTTVNIPGQSPMMLPSTFDNATKLFRFAKQSHMGAVTYGTAAIGLHQPRTAHSYLPEFESTLPQENAQRLSVSEFANKLATFFHKKWIDGGMPTQAPAGQDMVFFVVGYDEGSPHGRIFEIAIPSKIIPFEHMPDPMNFGLIWGGQKEIVERLLNGCDQATAYHARTFLQKPAPEGVPDPLYDELKRRQGAKIPWQFLPLQDCVDLSIFLIKTTITLQKWLVDVRGVGGHIDVATVTPIDGFRNVQQKTIRGENLPK